MVTETRSNYANRIKDLVETTVRGELGGIVERVETRFEDNYEGEPSLFTDVVLTETAPADLGRRFTLTRVAVLNALREIGEDRFPYLATKRPQDEYPDETVKSRKRRA